MAIVLISGGTGLVGKAICKHLVNSGHEVRVLSRHVKQSANIKTYFWDVENKQIDEAAFDGVEHIVHLAGSGIADKRWTEQRKQDIINSRVDSMNLIASILNKKNIKLKSFVGASAVGIYGAVTSDKIYSETDKGSCDFLAQSCEAWEKSYDSVFAYSNKTSIIRIGIVLSKNGGALAKLLPLFNFGLGSAVGSGKQYMPWIHIQDLVSIFTEALFNPNYSGTYNAVAPSKTTNQAFSSELAKALKKPFFLPAVPAFALKAAFGEMANVLLEGSLVSSEKLTKTGYSFRYTDISSALENIVSEK